MVLVFCRFGVEIPKCNILSHGSSLALEELSSVPLAESHEEQPSPSSSQSDPQNHDEHRSDHNHNAQKWDEELQKFITSHVCDCANIMWSMVSFPSEEG